MRMYKGILIAGLLTLGAVSGASAATFTVTATTVNGQFVFSPAVLPPAGMAVHPGDTITFENPGAGFHNAHSADPNFSFECGKGNSCATGVADPSAWTASIVVPETAAGHTISYICDIHGFLTASGQGSGMAGTIAVTAQTTPVELQAFDVY